MCTFILILIRLLTRKIVLMLMAVHSKFQIRAHLEGDLQLGQLLHPDLDSDLQLALLLILDLVADLDADLDVDVDRDLLDVSKVIGTDFLIGVGSFNSYNLLAKGST